MTTIETLKARLPNGNKAEAALVYDLNSDTTNPREGDNLGTILIAPSKAHWVANRDVAVDISIPFGNSPYEHWENLRREQLQLKKSDIAISYPITKHEHGGEIRLSLGCGQSGCWDNDVVGFIYVTKDQVRTWYGVERITKSITEHAKACLKSEVDLLTAWLNGECYGWQVKEYTLDDDGLDWKVVGVLESRWGYFDKEQAVADMQDMLIAICQSANHNP